jgi:hypothetical protein
LAIVWAYPPELLLPNRVCRLSKGAYFLPLNDIAHAVTAALRVKLPAIGETPQRLLKAIQSQFQSTFPVS